MLIEEGKYYVTRTENMIAGPMESAWHMATKHGWRSPSAEAESGRIYWAEDGKWVANGMESSMDLAREATLLEVDWAKRENKIGCLIELPKFILDAPQAAPASMTKHALLDLAKEATADRGLNYGKPEDNFARIARRWNVHLINRGYIPDKSNSIYLEYGGPITPGDVAIMCGDLKIARLENTPDHKDSWVDLAGYAACGAEIELGGKPPGGGAAIPHRGATIAPPEPPYYKS